MRAKSPALLVKDFRGPGDKNTAAAVHLLHKDASRLLAKGSNTPITVGFIAARASEANCCFTAGLTAGFAREHFL